jgi:hypothetical protein
LFQAESRKGQDVEIKKDQAEKSDGQRRAGADVAGSDARQQEWGGKAQRKLGENVRRPVGAKSSPEDAREEADGGELVVNHVMAKPAPFAGELAEIDEYAGVVREGAREE